MILSKRNLLIPLYASTLGLSCADAPETPQPEAFSAPAVCAGGPGIEALRVWPNEQRLGPASNVITRADAQELLVVVSGDNTVSRLTKDGFKPSFVDVGSDRNPYDVAFDDEHIYATNYLSNSVSVADRATGAIKAEIKDEAFKTPSGIAVMGDYLFVGNANYMGPDLDYGDAAVVVIERSSLKVVATVPLAHKNAQFLEVIQGPEGPMLAIVSTGELKFRGGGARVTSPGALTLWTLTQDPAAPLQAIYPLPLREDDPRQGGPGRPMLTPDGRWLYLTSATTPSLYKFDLMQRRWAHDTTNPLVFDDLEGDALHHGTLDGQGVIYITSFNRDALFAWDTRCDKPIIGPISLGVDSTFLEGPHGLAVWSADATQTTLYFITSLASVMGRIQVNYTP